MFKSEQSALHMVERLKHVLQGYNPYEVPKLTNDTYWQIQRNVKEALTYVRDPNSLADDEMSPDWCRKLLQRAANFLNAEPEGSITEELVKAGLLDDEAAG